MKNLPASPDICAASRVCMRYAQACKIIIGSTGANAHNSLQLRLQIIGQASALSAVPVPMPMHPLYMDNQYTIQIFCFCGTC